MKTFSYVWNGDETNLSRFGSVKKGDVLTLSEHEHNYVQKNGDRRYKFVKDESKIEEVPLPEDPVEREAEIKRRELLAKSADEDSLHAQTLREMSLADLIGYGKSLGLKLEATSDREHILATVLAADGNAKRNS